MDFLTPTLPFIESLQRYPGLLRLMQIFSILGTEYFYLALVPIIYWGVSRPLGIRVGALLLFSAIVNEIFKVGFAQPRPYWLESGLKMGNENSFGFPSGHAQNAFLIWTFLALHTRQRGLWVSLALLLAVCISFSRIYLGVHFPTDVIGGAAIGLTILGLARAAGPAWMRFWHQLSVFQQLTFVFFATAFLSGAYAVAMSIGTHGYAVDYNSPALKTIQNAMSFRVIVPRLGAFFGFLCAATLAARNLRFEARTTLVPLALRFLVGFLGLVVFYQGPVLIGKSVPALSGNTLSFLRYGMTTFWVIYGAVWVFNKLKINGFQREALSTKI